MDTQRFRILGISGSLKKDSSTLRAIKEVLTGAAETGAETRLLEPDELRLPLFDDRSDPQSYAPEVARFLDAVRATHGIVLGSPAYHGMMSAALKNALEFIELLATDTPPLLYGKVLALVNVAAGSPSSSGINALQWACRPLKAWILPISIATTSTALAVKDGHIDRELERRLHQQGAELAYWTKIIRQGTPFPYPDL